MASTPFDCVGFNKNDMVTWLEETNTSSFLGSMHNKNMISCILDPNEKKSKSLEEPLDWRALPALNQHSIVSNDLCQSSSGTTPESTKTRSIQSKKGEQPTHFNSYISL